MGEHSFDERARRLTKALSVELPATYVPDNKPLYLVDPFNCVLVDPSGFQIGWDGDVFADGGTGLGDTQVSTLNVGRVVPAIATNDTRGL